MALSDRVVWVILAGIIPVLVWPTGDTARVWLLLVVLACVIDLVLAASPRKVSLRRANSAALRWGESVDTTLTVVNDSGRTLRALVRDAWQPSAGVATPRGQVRRRRDRHRIRLRAGEATGVTTTLTPTRRGAIRADRVTIRSFGPLGLAARQRSIPVDGLVRVLPAFPSRRHLPSRLRRLHEIEGNAVVQLHSQGSEFDSLRDYVRGDDVRSIDWRATARRRALVTRVWRPERDRHILVVLDTSRLSAGRIGDVPRLDAGMDAVLLLSALASHAGDRVSFVAGDRVVRAQVAGRPRTDLVSALSEAMTELDPTLAEADWNVLGGAVSAEIRRASLFVVITPIEPAVARETILPFLARSGRRSATVIASVADPSLDELAADRHDLNAVHLAAAAERALADRERAAAALAATGAEIIDAAPEEVAVRLADHYLDLKAQGRL